jgi:hypothetical protein
MGAASHCELIWEYLRLVQVDSKIGGRVSSHAVSSQTWNPSLRRHSLWASINAVHLSSPWRAMHSSRGPLVSGQAQQIFSGFSSAGILMTKTWKFEYASGRMPVSSTLVRV